jgi:hypothetical protein
MVSNETELMIKESAVKYNLLVEGPLAKVVRVGLSAEGQADRRVVLVNATAGVVKGVEGQNLKKEIMSDMHLAQAPRSKTFPYTRRTTQSPSTAVRNTARNQGTSAGTTALVKAQRLAAEKNLEATCKANGTDSTLLGFLSDSHLALIIVDSSVLFNPNAGTPTEALSLIRAKE